MIFRSHKNLRTTARSTPRATAAKAVRAARRAGRTALAFLIAALMTVPPAFAGIESNKAPAAASNLKWRTPKSAPIEQPSARDEKTTDEKVSVEKVSDEKTGEAYPAAETPAEKTESTATKSGSRLNIRTIPDAKTTAKSGVAAATKTAGKAGDTGTAKTTASKAARPRSKVTRLSDAASSPSTSSVASSGNSLKILRTSNEEPLIEPFGDDMPVLRSADVRAKKRAVQAGMQEGNRGGFDPFGDASPLERVPSGTLPDRVPAEGLAQGPRPIPAVCPSPKEYIKKLSDISTNIAVEPGELPQECGLGDEAFVPRNWQNTLFAWKASALCHKPLYFEDVELERYGQTCSPLLQPFISGAKFWLTLPILPYKFGLEPPCECIYPLGYYRPGSCAPFIIPPVPISLRGALLEAGVWVAGVALVP